VSAIASIESGDRVLAASQAAEQEQVEPQELAAVAGSASWRDRACERLKSTARLAALPVALLGACDVGAPPAADAAVLVYDVRTGDWFEDEAGDVGPGGELLHDGHLYRVEHGEMVDLGSASLDQLAGADATVTAAEAARVPPVDAWVLVLAHPELEARHARLADVQSGERFALQGKVFDTSDADRDGALEVRWSGDVVAVVAATFVRVAPEVIDAEVAYSDGSTDIVTGTLRVNMGETQAASSLLSMGMQ
jgi:hypothetical protein